jgi:DNA-binding MarR family transcriptional regulator
MTDQPTLVETERAMRSHVTALELDFEAAHAVSSIYRAANAVRSHVTNEVLRPCDISWTGFVVMWVVWIWDGLETRHAADAAAISKATLTGVVKTLEARGWMQKRGRDDDRRLVELHLTPAGVGLMEELYPRFNAIEAAVVGGLSSRRKKDLTSSLRHIVSVIEAAEQPSRSEGA